MVESGRKWVIDMFMGQFNHNIDEKGRIIIPSKFRDKLEPTLIATKGFDGCIALYPNNEWEKFLTNLSKLPTNMMDARKHIRVLVGSASECSFDKQGRINLPANLIKDAALDKECVVVGNLEHIEIWSKERWEAYYNDASDNFEDVAEKLSSLDKGE